MKFCVWAFLGHRSRTRYLHKIWYMGSQRLLNGQNLLLANTRWQAVPVFKMVKWQ